MCRTLGGILNGRQTQGPNAGHGANSVQIREHNERVILQRLRRGGEASKSDLARAARLTNSAVANICDDLESRGLLQFAGKRPARPHGQPATLLRLDPAGAYGIGVRLDRGRVETLLADFAGTVLSHLTHDGPLPSPARTMALVRDDVARLIASLPRPRRNRIAGIGLARPHNLGSWLHELDLPREQFASWQDFDFAFELAGATRLQVFEENDGSAAAIAELFHGRGCEQPDFLYLFVGPSISGGVVLGGDYLRGVSGNGGDVGMMPVAASELASAPRAQGGRTVLLARASLNALMRHLRHAGATAHGPADLPWAIESAPQAFEEWLADCAAALVEPLLAAHALLDTPVVIIDSDLPPAALQGLFPRLDAALRDAVPEARAAPDLLPGRFGPLAGALGAATLPLFIYFGPSAGALGDAGSNTQWGGIRHVAVA